MLDTEGVEDNGQPLRIFVHDIVLLDALIVDDVNQARQLVYVDIDAEEQIDILLDVVTNDYNFARLAVNILWAQDVGADLLDAIDADDLRLSIAVSVRIPSEARHGGGKKWGQHSTHPNWKLSGQPLTYLEFLTCKYSLIRR